ncbi:MAG: SPOR domain-containing protein [Bacteroidales bacterium]|nr:SPOR domain-containing protein [Bacteroidales bacterium]
MRVSFLFHILFISIIFNANAQLAGTKLMRDIQYSDSPGKVTIVQNSDIVKLVDKHLFEEGKRKGISGYRIRIFSDSGSQARKQGRIIEAGFIGRFKGINTYFLFDSPFYRLYIGDFRTQSEALKFLRQIEGEYPDAFVVRSNINYPSL